MKKTILGLLICILCLNLITSDFGYDNPNLPKLQREITSSTFNNNTANVNDSTYWAGHPYSYGEVSSIETDPIWTANSTLVPYLAENNIFIGNNTFKDHLTVGSATQSDSVGMAVKYNTTPYGDGSSKQTALFFQMDSSSLDPTDEELYGISGAVSATNPTDSSSGTWYGGSYGIVWSTLSGRKTLEEGIGIQSMYLGLGSTINNWYGFKELISGNVIGNRYGVYLINPTVSGSGNSLDNNTAIYVERQTTGTNDIAMYFDGSGDVGSGISFDKTHEVYKNGDDLYISNNTKINGNLNMTGDLTLANSTSALNSGNYPLGFQSGVSSGITEKHYANDGSTFLYNLKWANTGSVPFNSTLMTFDFYDVTKPIKQVQFIQPGVIGSIMFMDYTGTYGVGFFSGLGLSTTKTGTDADPAQITFSYGSGAYQVFELYKDTTHGASLRPSGSVTDLGMNSGNTASNKWKNTYIQDNGTIYLGNNADTGIYFDGTDLNIDTQLAGSGNLNILGGNLNVTNNITASNLPLETNQSGDMYVCWSSSDGHLYLNETGCR